MATTEPTTRPPVEDEEPTLSTSSRAEPTTPSPSPSPSPSTTSSSPPPTTSSPPPTTSPSPSPSPSESESEEPSTTSTSTSSSTSTSTSSSTSTTPSSTSTSTSSSTSSSTRTTETITVSQSRPGLVTSFSSISRSSTVSGAAASSTGKGGVGGSGLPIGGLVGIIIGAIVALCLIALIVTRTIRKRARSRRTAHRTSMFEPWPAPVTMEEEDDLEKARYSPPSQAYPMQNTGSYDYETYNVYGQAGVGAGAAAAGAAATYPPSNGNDYQYPQQDYGYGSQQGHEYAQQPGVPPPVTGGTAASMGLHDGMMTRVQVGFNRTLEDELAIAPGQQLWLHNVYDDGWAMCEDQNQHRGVVPVTSLVPWSDDDPNHLSGMSRSHTGESLSGTSQRRSSLYANVQAGTAYLNQPQ